MSHIPVSHVTHIYFYAYSLLPTGNTAGGDGCNSTCHDEECGNGVLDVGEECDDGNTANCDRCSSCKKDVCGDGQKCDSIEECDDGISAYFCVCMCVCVRVPVGVRNV